MAELTAGLMLWRIFLSWWWGFVRGEGILVGWFVGEFGDLGILRRGVRAERRDASG